MIYNNSNNNNEIINKKNYLIKVNLPVVINRLSFQREWHPPIVSMRIPAGFLLRFGPLRKSSRPARTAGR